jgi:hypothetical protein
VTGTPVPLEGVSIIDVREAFDESNESLVTVILSPGKQGDKLKEQS